MYKLFSILTVKFTIYKARSHSGYRDSFGGHLCVWELKLTVKPTLEQVKNIVTGETFC